MLDQFQGETAFGRDRLPSYVRQEAIDLAWGVGKCQYILAREEVVNGGYE